MTTQVNWKKIQAELQRFADVDKLKSEVQRIGGELRQLDFHSVLSPSAQAKVKGFEKRYSELMRTMHQAQRQVDREFNRIVRQIKSHRSDVTKVVNQQRTKLEKVSRDMRKRFAAATKSAQSTKAAKAGTATRKKTVRRSK